VQGWVCREKTGHRGGIDFPELLLLLCSSGFFFLSKREALIGSGTERYQKKTVPLTNYSK
jgi:hypothetical protein